GHGREVPAVGVDHVHAVAVAGDDAAGLVAVGNALDDVRPQVGDAGDGDDALDAVVGGGEPPARRPAAGPAGDPEPVGVHLGPRLEVVERPHRVPALDAAGRVAQALPPPQAVLIGAVVDALDLAELQRIDDQRHVAVLGEPGRVDLRGDLAAVGD